MIFVHLSKSWPDVISGHRNAADVTLGDWALVSDDAIAAYGDVICGVYQSEVVTAYDVTGFVRGTDGRVRFDGTPSRDWSSLVGEASPVTWTRGQARPVRYLDTEILRSGTVETEQVDHGVHRAVVGGYTLTVDTEGNATLVAPAGGAVTVTSRAS
ncbi:hypothetical protein ACI8AC_06260 [Geodermatophilus sp. SYSU D00758]